MDPEYPDLRRSGNKALIIVLAVVGGLGVLMLAVCAGCGLWAFRSITTDIPPAQASADAFLADLRAGRLDAAYASTSSDFRTAQSAQQFQEFINRFSTFKTHTSRTVANSMVYQGTGGKQVTLKLTLHAPDNAMSCTCIMVQESGLWKVQRISVP